MKKALTKDEALAFFCEQMEQPALKLALHRSFKRYAELRDQLAVEFERATNIPADEALSAYALYSFLKNEQSLKV